MQYIHVGWASPTISVGEAHPTFFQVKLEDHCYSGCKTSPTNCYTLRGHKSTFSIFSPRRKDRQEYKNFASFAPLREIKKNAIYALVEYIWEKTHIGIFLLNEPRRNRLKSFLKPKKKYSLSQRERVGVRAISDESYSA